MILTAPRKNPIFAFATGLLLAGLVACTGTEQRELADDGGASSQAATPVTVLSREELEALGVTPGRTDAAMKRPNNAPVRALVAQEYLLYLPPAVQDRENYAHIVTNPLRLTQEHPVSTFSIDVDTASYSNVRRFLNQGVLPPEDAVRVEELINYFSYDYSQPEGDAPFSVYTELAPAPWDEEASLLLVGIEGMEIQADERPDANLVFLIDVSGSMQSADKLELLKKSFRLLVRRMGPDDRIAMVVYAGATGVVLESTPGDQASKILAALSQLQAGGSTNGGAGIELAYSIAAGNYIDGGINRVVLATDGDFNVGTVDFDSLIDMVERRRAGGISLTTLGFGQGNINDRLLEQLADKGNGNYAYIDNLREARKVLVEEMSSTLQTIAGDVKIQIEFNPDQVAEYRLIGYENRVLRREDFNNDKIDAGEIGAGHSVTALYELHLVDSESQLVDPLRYGKGETRTTSGEELAFLKLRYKDPGETRSKLIQSPIMASDMISLRQSSDNFRFAAAVAAFGQSLRGGEYLAVFDYDDIIELALDSRGEDRNGYRAEFVSLVTMAGTLSEEQARASL